jgi:hypothetical protein
VVLLATFAIFYQQPALAVYVSHGGHFVNVRMRLLARYKTETIVGLVLGSPDENPDNDWMTGLGQSLTIRGYDVNTYCVVHWCIRDQSKSLFTYEGGHTLEDITKFDDEPFGSPGFTGVS